MNLSEIIYHLDLKPLTAENAFDRIKPTGGYASDLLSCVMAGAKQHNLWITLQAHSNIIAIASLLDLSAVIITENSRPDEATLAKANEQNVILLSTPESTFTIVGRLWEIGMRAEG